MNTYGLLHFEDKNYIAIIVKLYRATGSIQKFQSDYDVSFMFKM